MAAEYVAQYGLRLPRELEESIARFRRLYQSEEGTMP